MLEGAIPSCGVKDWKCEGVHPVVMVEEGGACEGVETACDTCEGARPFMAVVAGRV